MTAPDAVLVDGKPLGFYHFTGFDSGAHAVMAERNGVGNRTLEQLVAWYHTAIRTIKDDALAAMPWAYGRYGDGTAIEPGHRRVYGLRASLQRAFPDPFSTKEGPPLADSQRSFAAWVRAKGASEYPQHCGDTTDLMAGLRAENTRLRDELRQIKLSFSWRVTKPLRLVV